MVLILYQQSNNDLVVHLGRSNHHAKGLSGKNMKQTKIKF